jgi:hypothetical protein
MDLQTLQKHIKENLPIDSFYIFVNTENSFLSNQYINAISTYKNLRLVYVDEIDSLIPDKNDIFGCTEVIDDSCLYVYRVEKFDNPNINDIKEIKNLIIVTDKVDKDIESLYSLYITVMPKLENWQIKDYVYSIADGVNPKKLDWLIDLCGADIYRLHNELSKVSIFKEKERDAIFDLLLNDDSFSDLSNYVIFDLTNALLKRDIRTVCQILSDSEHFDLEPLGLQVIMTNNLKNIISIQLDRTATAEKLGMKSGQFYAVSKSCGYYNKDQLLKMYEIIAEADYKMKNGEISNDKLVDYIVLNMLAV